MGEATKIEWTDSINPQATGRTLGAYKSAAAKCGVSVDRWIERRASGHRHCFRCRQWKTEVEFSVDKSRNGGRSSSCKSCTSDASTVSRYGMTLEELIAFRVKHENQCDICRKADGPLYVDHNHETGALRGLLCPGCNTAIGLLGESPAHFAAALSYLEHHRG